MSTELEVLVYAQFPTYLTQVQKGWSRVGSRQSSSRTLTETEAHSAAKSMLIAKNDSLKSSRMYMRI